MDNYYDDSGFALINGDGNISDYVQESGGSGSAYLATQTPYDVFDNGYIFSDAGTVTSGPAKSPTGTTGKTSAGLPAFLSSILSLAGTAEQVTAQVTGTLNNRPANSPANPGSTPRNGVVQTKSGFPQWALYAGIAVVVAVIAFFALGRKARA